jgi:hypothetical protein
VPNTRRKKRTAINWPEPRISSFGMAATYATLMKRYKNDTNNKEIMPDFLTVCTGLEPLTSARTLKALFQPTNAWFTFTYVNDEHRWYGRSDAHYGCRNRIGVCCASIEQAIEVCERILDIRNTKKHSNPSDYHTRRRISPTGNVSKETTRDSHKPNERTFTSDRTLTRRSDHFVDNATPEICPGKGWA